MSKSEKAIAECLDAALPAARSEKANFYDMLQSKYGVDRDEVAEKFETVHVALAEAFGKKHYAIERKIIQNLHDRARTGRYDTVDEISAASRVIDTFLSETEMDLTASHAGLALLDLAKRMRRDIEENKEKLQAAERMTAIGQTAGMVGHDLRNPLQTIVGELWLAKNELKRVPDSDAKNCLQESITTIEEQVRYMDKIVSDLQTYVKPVTVNTEPIRLKNAVNAVLAQTKIPRNIRTNVQINPFQNVSADRDLLKRVLMNLVLNSVQAMPKGGELTVRALDEAGDITIIVEDTGAGIPDKTKPKIFTPLFTTKSKGQGFGLAVCKRIIEAHGGTISFESQEGKGTKFIIRLPAEK